MAKSRDAFRTISEVSDWLDTPAHVLRFWESKFSQIKPVKRAGGRRYYRPQDMDLLSGIKILLHDQGMTIKGAQKLLREQGVKYVSGLADQSAAAPAPTTPAAAPEVKNTPVAPVAAKPKADDTVVAFSAMPPPTQAPAAAPQAVAAPVAKPAPAPEPLLPREPAQSAEPRIFAALRDARPDKLRARAAQIVPLLDRLQTVRDRMRQT